MNCLRLNSSFYFFLMAYAGEDIQVYSSIGKFRTL